MKPSSMEVHTGLALSVRQPYLDRILQGTKRFEYRNRPVNIRGRVWLYAPKTPEDGGEELPLGVIVGSVAIVGCYTSDREGWEYRWALSYPERFPEPLEVLGLPQPGLWKPKGIVAPFDQYRLSRRP